MLSNLHLKGVSGRVLLGFSLILLICIGALGATLFNLNHVADSFNINYTKKLPAQLNVSALEKKVVDMETGLRGYLLTSDDVFLEPYESGEDEISALIEKTKELLDDADPILIENLNEIEELLGQWDNEVAGVEIVLMQEGRIDEAHTFVRSGEGKRLFDAMRAKFANLHGLLNAETAEHYKTVGSLVTRSNQISLMMIALLLLLGAGVIWQVISYLNRRLETITMQAEQVARGSFKESYAIDDIEDELSPVLMSLRDIDRAFHEMTVQAKHIGQGDYSSDISLRSASDEMGLAMQHMVQTLRDVVEVVGQVADGDLRGKVTVKGDNDQLAAAINSMTSNLQAVTDEVNEQLWLQQGVAAVSDAVRGEQDLAQLSKQVIAAISTYLKMEFGALYYMMPSGEGKQEKKSLKMVASHHYVYRKVESFSFEVGESLVGQAAFEGKVVVAHDFPDDYIALQTGLHSKHGQQKAQLKSILAIPFLFEDEVKGVIELGSQHIIGSAEIEFLESVTNMITIAFNAVDSRQDLGQAFGEAQDLAHALQQQQEALQITNDTLEEQTLTLEKAHEQAEERNVELEQAQRKLNKHAQDLALSSQYKSEFLANMSHELRTPLNSILLLSKMLADGRSGAVNEQQSKQAHVIHSAGSDLLQLINEILELSKIEAGQMNIHLEDVVVVDFAHQFSDLFAPLAADKALTFEVQVAEGLPTRVHTDRGRVQQVLRNFLSNAFKFTQAGGVHLHVSAVLPEHIEHLIADGQTKAKIDEDADDYLVFSVIDTGVGISASNKEHIFEAFQQEDGSTSRRFGGTGLGLSISREISQMLSGAIALQTTLDEGSIFSLIVPRQQALVQQVVGEAVAAIEKESLQDDTLALFKHVKAGGKSGILLDKKVLLVDDDIRNTFALSSMLQQNSMQVVTAENGHAALAKLDRSVDIVLMDIMMPEMDGYTAIQHIRSMDMYQNIPIIALTAKALKGDREQCLADGASNYLPKPIDGDALLQMMQEELQLCAQATKKEVKC